MCSKIHKKAAIKSNNIAPQIGMLFLCLYQPTDKKYTYFYFVSLVMHLNRSLLNENSEMHNKSQFQYLEPKIKN